MVLDIIQVMAGIMIDFFDLNVIVDISLYFDKLVIIFICAYFLTR